MKHGQPNLVTAFQVGSRRLDIERISSNDCSSEEHALYGEHTGSVHFRSSYSILVIWLVSLALWLARTIDLAFIIAGKCKPIFYVFATDKYRSNPAISNSVNSKLPLFRTKIECPCIYPYVFSH